MPPGRTARVLSRVDVLISRLAEFQATGHQDVGQQVLVLLKSVPGREREDLRMRASSHRLTTILQAMSDLAKELARGRLPPESDELHEIARAALEAEYHRDQ
jgi:signal transduction histidine kinase